MTHDLSLNLKRQVIWQAESAFLEVSVSVNYTYASVAQFKAAWTSLCKSKINK